MIDMNTNANKDADNDIHSNDLTQLSSREQLSALMDGALPADQTRFLLRRLQHDDSLAGCWERWRLTGETMRGLAPAQRLPADFASRVSAVLHGVDTGASSAAVHAGGRRAPAWLRWGGGAAMAASLAAVAFMVRPAMERPLEQADQPAVQVAATATLPDTAGQQIPEAPVSATPTMAEAPQVLVAATAAAAAASQARNRPAVQDRATSTSSRSLAAVEAAAVATETTPLPVGMPQPDIVTRPWPRSVLPQYANGGLTVGFGDAQRNSAAYNPFQRSAVAAMPPAIPLEDAQVDAPTVPGTEIPANDDQTETAGQTRP